MLRIIVEHCDHTTKHVCHDIILACSWPCYDMFIAWWSGFYNLEIRWPNEIEKHLTHLNFSNSSKTISGQCLRQQHFLPFLSTFQYWWHVCLTYHCNDSSIFVKTSHHKLMNLWLMPTFSKMITANFSKELLKIEIDVFMSFINACSHQ